MHILSVLAAVLGATLGASLLQAGWRPTGRLPRWPLYFAAGAILTRVFTLALWLCGNCSRQAYPPQFAGLLAAAALVLAALAGST